MKNALATLLALGSISAFGFEVQCTDQYSGFEVSSGHEYKTVLTGPGKIVLEITKDIKLLVEANEAKNEAVHLSMVAANVNSGWRPYASARGINYLTLSLNDNSLSESLTEFDNKHLEGRKSKRLEAFEKLVAEKNAVKKEFQEKFGAAGLASFTCRVSGQ